MKQELRMTRRELVQRVAWLLSGAMGAPLVVDVLSGCSGERDASSPLVLDATQRAIIAEVAEIIIPRSDLPGAKDVGVPAFIESMLKDTLLTEEQEHFLSGLEDFETQARRQYGMPFLRLEPERRVAFVQSVQDSVLVEQHANQKRAQQLKAAEKKGLLPIAQLRALKRELTQMLHPHQPIAPPPLRPFLLTMKELTLLGFFTSRVGATQVLQYSPVPGSFQACIPVKEAGNGKTWAVETSYKF